MKLVPTRSVTTPPRSSAYMHRLRTAQAPERGRPVTRVSASARGPHCGMDLPACLTHNEVAQAMAVDTTPRACQKLIDEHGAAGRGRGTPQPKRLYTNGHRKAWGRRNEAVNGGPAARIARLLLKPTTHWPPTTGRLQLAAWPPTSGRLQPAAFQPAAGHVFLAADCQPPTLLAAWYWPPARSTTGRLLLAAYKCPPATGRRLLPAYY